jgi:Fe-S oxidoreductase
MWIEEQPGTVKISQRRMEEVLKTGVERVITTCPYCLQMFEENIEHKEALKAEDLIEVVEKAMRPH